AWGISNFVRGIAVDEFWDLEARLLKFENFSGTAATGILGGAEHLDGCDTHSQRALLLLEIPLADAALRSGAAHEYDLHIQSLEARTQTILSCSPRDSFGWLVNFGLEVQHGRLNEHTFDLLAMSYETSPNEAWVGVRRIVIAIPAMLAAPEAIREKVLAEFQNLIRQRFVEIPARAYLNASASTRALLQSSVEQLDPLSRKIFSDTLQRFRP
ncbi:MAG: hypothetical protein WCA28_05695, partial [Bradyrhizobium sp.]